MNSIDFVTSFDRKMKALQPTGWSKQWSEGMYQVLYQVGREAGFWPCCHPFEYEGERVGEREINNMDFMYFPGRPYEPTGDFSWQPDVVIEHENTWSWEGKIDDFWKLCFYLAPLRIFIGYTQSESEARDTAKRLTEFYNARRFRQLPELTIRRFWRGSSGQKCPVFQGFHYFAQLGLVCGVGSNGSVQSAAL
jgi:hypothetical protein